MSLLIAVDLDGTLTQAQDRFNEAGREPSRDNKVEYEAWVRKINSGMETDKPVSGMSTFLKTLTCMGLVDVVYVTSREESNRDITEAWLHQHKFPLAPLYMRPTGSWESTAELKLRLINRSKYVFKADEVIVIDDDQAGTIEKMCKENGFVFLKACSGGKEVK